MEVGTAMATQQARPERTQSTRARRDHSRQQSQARYQQSSELKTVGEYALHHLFNSFVGQADQKIQQCVGSAHEQERVVEDICGPGVDPQFDQLISALGHIVRQKPKPLIDTLMFWRKAKSEAANTARAEANVSRANAPPNSLAPRSNRGHAYVVSDPVNASATTMADSASPATAMSRHETVVQAERSSTVSIYLLCRVLMEIIRQSTLGCVTVEMADRLEDIIFGQLKGADIDQLLCSPFRMANWKIFGELLGVMSEMNFKGVVDRFLKELDRLHREHTAKGHVNKESVENKMELVIMGMRYFRLKLQPEEAFGQSCDFMLQLGRHFAVSHGQHIKHAYCRILERLLLPVAARAGPELNTQRWRTVVETFTPKISQMLLKPRHWFEASPVMAVLCCTSPADIFAQQWMQVINSLQPRLKDRMTRPSALQAIARLVWTYLYRVTDSQPLVIIKKLEDTIKTVLQSGKRSYMSTEPTIAEPLIQFIRIIGYRQQELCFKTVVFPMINSELFAPGRDVRVDQLEPERMVIGIRAFLAIMADLEKGDQGRPPFPQDFGRASLADRIRSTWLLLAHHVLAEPVAFIADEERLFRPVLTARLGDSARDHYSKFCEILGKLTIICDDAFGGQAVLDEKFSAITPKTPIAETFSFGRRDEHSATTDHRRGFYDLFHVAVQALPRCLSVDIPFNSIVNLLCTGTAHMNSNIAFSSAESLRSIARQSHAQQVTIGFARFILNFDDRYSTMSDGGMLGPGHIENTLKLYVELLRIWIDEIKQRAKEAARELNEEGVSGGRGAQLDFSGKGAYVDEVESHGLFFLCSQSRRVRSFAVAVLRLIKEFDVALGMESIRVIHILERDSGSVMDFHDESLSVAERSRLQRGMRKTDAHSALIELCSSEVTYDSTLWFKIFPNLVRIAADRCPFAVAVARDVVCKRLLQMHKPITILAEAPKGSQSAPFDILGNRSLPRTIQSPEVMIEQWKLYLIFACTTLTNAGVPQASSLQDFQHARKASRPSQQGSDKISSARGLFQFVIPLLAVSSSIIRDAVVTALGSINVNLYKILLDSLQSVVAMCNDEGKTRLHQRNVSSPRRNRPTDRLRTEITHVYKLTSHFLREEAIYTDDAILDNLVTYTNALKIFLSDTEVQNDWEFQKLRRHYCGLLEELFEGINRTKDPSRWMPFEARKSAFALMEEWCGYSPNHSQVRQREDNMRQSMIEQQRDFGDKVTASMEIEKRNLRTAALSAMAALCGGPVSVTNERKANLQFDVRRMLSWIEAIFNTPSDKLHAIGHRALKNLIVHNRGVPYIIEQSIHMCYVAESSKALQSYFGAISEVLLENEDYPLKFWKVVGAALFMLGHEKNNIRSKSAHLLRTLEERLQKSSKIQDFEIGVTDKTTAVYKLAQFEISKRLAKQHSDLAFLIFSEFTSFFRQVDANKQRSIVAAILPWVQTVELQLDPGGGPTAQSYMLLTNLFEITISSGAILHNEVQALWQALATGPHGGNVQLVLDFIILLCLDRRDQNFVDFAKQIVVFLSSTPAGQKVIEFLLLQITPRSMVQEKKEHPAPLPETSSLPYVADLSAALPVGSKQAGFSLGQLSLILLVDLIVSPVELAPDNIPILLQIAFVLWDHYTPMVQDQAREMLVHLIHELVISKLDEQRPAETKNAVQSVVDSVRQHDQSVIWAYDDNNSSGKLSENRVPKAMELLAAQVVNVFELQYPGVREQWGKKTLSWATSCPVRHLACRSFQLFRCILTSLDQHMLGDMLARLSNTIADDESDIQTFSMEILTTLKTIIQALSPADLLQYPQLFWSTCACLNTIHESEFVESLAMLECFIDKVDLGRQDVVNLLADNIPAKWEGSFEGVQPMVYPGVRSSLSLERTMVLLDKLGPLPSNYLVGNDSRLLFSILANLPSLLHEMELEMADSVHVKRAERLAQIAEGQGCSMLAHTLMAYATSSFRTTDEFLASVMAAMRETFLPAWDFRCVVFLMGMLNNRLGWFKIKTMQLLCVIIQGIDMRKPEIASHGSDLISPLLRLLQTEYCSQALEVLDHIMGMPGTPMDNRHMRMSMVGSKSRAVRKEFEHTESLFGIPDETGWSIPMPAVHSANTRANVHAVFYTCAGTESAKSGINAPHGLEFHADDFQYTYPYQDRTGTMMSDDIRTDGNMGDLVMKLNSLDEFFEGNVVAGGPATDNRSQNITIFPLEAGDAGARYDQQTLPLLRKSLTRTASVSSLHNGFTDARTGTARDMGVMSPTAFAAPPGPPGPSHPGAAASAVPSSSRRPSMQPRMMTSPQGSTGGELLSDDDYYVDDVFSDDEAAVRGAPNGLSPEPTHPSTIGSRLRSGTRSGMRRLAGVGHLRDRGDVYPSDRRPTVVQQHSPKVPRIPSTYLQHGPTAQPHQPHPPHT